MRPLLSYPVVVAATLLLATSASAFDSELLFRSGLVVPDGRTISYFSTPRASRPTRGVFGGVTSAILTKSGSTFAVVAKTGDSLPSPLSGQFNTLTDPAINDSGAVVFRAELNASSAESGLFLYAGATMTPISLFGGTMGGTDRVGHNPDINDANEVLYQTTTTLVLWSGGVSTSIVNEGDPSPGGGTFSSFGNSVLSRSMLLNAAVVAFEGQVSGGPNGVFTWDPTNGLRAVALRNGAAPGFSGATFRLFSKSTPVSINRLGQIAFTTDVALPSSQVTTAVYGYDPSGPTLFKVAANGDPVGTDSIFLLPKDYVGINDSGVIAFYADMTTGLAAVVQWSGGPLSSLTGPIGNVGDFEPRLTNARHLVWRVSGSEVDRYDGAVTKVIVRTDTTPAGVAVLPRAPSINDSDVTAFSVTHTVLYGYDEGAITALVTPGSPSPGGPSEVYFFGTPVLRSSALAVNVTDLDGGAVLALKRGDGPFAAVVRSTDVTPVGGTFDLYDSAGGFLDVSGQTLVFESTITDGTAGSGVFRVKASTGIVTPIALENDTAPNGALFRAFTAVAIAGKEAVFAADLDDGTHGLFITSHGAITAIALSGDPVPGTASATFTSFSTIAARGSQIAFTAATTAGRGIFGFHRGTLSKVALEGDPTPSGGTFVAIDEQFGAPALGAKGPAFVATFSGAAGEGLFAADGPLLTTRALLGDTVFGSYDVPSPGIITEIATGEPLAFAGRVVVFAAAMDAPSGSAWGLMANLP
jgi:hypothetical protein